MPRSDVAVSQSRYETENFRVQAMYSYKVPTLSQLLLQYLTNAEHLVSFGYIN